METLIADYLSKLEFGELQSFKNMGVIPVYQALHPKLVKSYAMDTILRGQAKE